MSPAFSPEVLYTLLASSSLADTLRIAAIMADGQGMTPASEPPARRTSTTPAPTFRPCR